jgi:NAD(P) transhydrogenase subunit alpha
MSVTTRDLAVGTFIFGLSVLIGFELISKVPSTLHTPLMSGTNAIHGIVLVGAIIIASSSTSTLGDVIAVGALVLGTLNVVGGFIVTDRMLGMFKRRPALKPQPDESENRG